MNTLPGLHFVVSLIFLTVVVASVYSIARDPFSCPRTLVRQSLRRGGKLLGVLALIMLVVFFLSKM
jgi:hypothetical protein